MRAVATGAALSAAVLAVGYLVLNSPAPGRDPLAPPRRAQARTDDRVSVTLQLCWWPEDNSGVIRSTIGDVSKVDVEMKRPCSHPWSRTGLVKEWQRITLGWVLNPGSPETHTIDYRITINNREAKRDQKTTTVGQFDCMVGVPPCLL